MNSVSIDTVSEKNNTGLEKSTFWEFHMDPMTQEAFQDFLETLHVFLEGFPSDDDIIDITRHTFNSLEDSVHRPLKDCWS